MFQRLCFFLILELTDTRQFVDIFGKKNERSCVRPFTRSERPEHPIG